MSRTSPAGARAAWLIAPLLLAGCAVGPRVLSRAPEPSAAVKTFEIGTLQRQRASLALEIEIDNPGEPLRLVSADYEVFVEDRSFAVGTAALDHRAAGHQRSSVTLPIELAYLDLPMRVRGRVRTNEPIRVVVRGHLQGLSDGGPASVPFDAEAEALVTEDPGRPAP